MTKWIDANPYISRSNKHIDIFNYDECCISLLAKLSFSDEQIEDIIRAANIAFEKGFEQGKKAKLYELKTALDLI